MTFNNNAEGFQQITKTPFTQSDIPLPARPVPQGDGKNPNTLGMNALFQGTTNNGKYVFFVTDPEKNTYNIHLVPPGNCLHAGQKSYDVPVGTAWGKNGPPSPDELNDMTP